MFGKILAALGAFAVTLTAILFVDGALSRRATLAALEGFEPPAAYRIERDEYGVPSIYGATDPAVAYGVAVAHAEDDFETIQLRLAAVHGQSGAILGPDGAKFDMFGRIIGVRETLAQRIGDLSDEARAVARAYAGGINAYAAAHPDEILRHQIFPVTEADVIGGFVLVSPVFYGLDGVVGDLVAGNVPDPSHGPEHKGSNAFAIAPSKMKDGSTVLISNSHQPWSGVAAWWEARLASGEGWSMAGATFPGVPFILMGYNEYLSWTNTVNVPDLADIYRLELDEIGGRYLYDGGWRELEEEVVWLKVRFGPLVLPVRQKVYRSVHGPVIKNDDGAFAIRYAGMGETRLYEQYYRLNRVKSFDEWRDVMGMQAIPATNFLYADREGNIAYLYNASFPDRSPEIDWSGTLPGDDPALVWTGYEPQEEIPFYVNPKSGYLVNANNTPLLATAEADNFKPDEFADLVGIETKTTNRILRALKLMDGYEQYDREILDRIKYDEAYDQASPLGKLFVDLVVALPEDADQEAGALLRTWDYTLDGKGRADAIASLVLYDLYLGMRGYEPVPEPGAALAQAAAHLREHYGRLDPAYGELSRLRRGEVDVPVMGGPDALRAIYWDPADDGAMVAGYGDSYIAYVRWDADGQLHAETIYPFGAAMGRPDSPHYDDQAPLFADRRMKPAPLPDWRDATPEALSARE